MTREEREKAAQYFKWWKAQIENIRNELPKNTVAYNAYQTEISFHDAAIEALEQEPIEKCIWIKYDYRTICPRECGGENPYWRIPENMENLKYCPYCGREIEVEE